MRRVIAVSFFVCAFALGSNAQTGCNKTWLLGQRTVTGSVNWEEFTDPLAKLFESHYVQLPSDLTKQFPMRFTIGNRYTVLYYTEATALASGIEIYDPRGVRLEFEKVYGKQRNNAIELTIEPAYSGTYILAVRSIYPNDKTTCAALLVREWDDVEWEERLELLGLEE